MGANPAGRHRSTAIVLLSGGIDSSTLAAHLARSGVETQGLFIDYGQRAAVREWAAAQLVADELRISVRKADVASLRVDYQGQIVGRNAFFLLTALMCVRPSQGLVGIGIHDGSDYADCTRGFVEAMQGVFDIYCSGLVQVAAPFLTWGKADVFEYAGSLGVPLPLTYSCELGLGQPCGRCRSCDDLERLSARA